MNKKKWIVMILTIATLSVCAQAQHYTSGTNEVSLPGFEKNKPTPYYDVGNWKLPDNAVRDTKISYEGKFSLRLEGKAATQNIVTVPAGETVRFGAWMRGNNVQGDANVQFTCGSAPQQTSTLQGTFGWKWRESTFTLPQDVSQCTIQLNPGKSGQVWFDNVIIERQLPAMQVFLRWPNYRSLLPSGNTDPLQAAIELADSRDLPRSLEIESKLIDTQGKVLERASSKLKDISQTQYIDLPLKNKLALGEYQWSFQLKDDEGNTLQEERRSIEVVQQMPKVYVRKDGRLIRNGKPFFPFGLYVQSNTTTEDISRIANAGFNTVLNYANDDNPKFGFNMQQYLDDAQKNNLAVIISVKDMYPYMSGGKKYKDKLTTRIDNLLDQYKNYHGLVGWYINDETPPVRMPSLAKMYNHVRSSDPDHPAFITLYRPNQPKKFFNTTDAISTDPYPYGWAPWNAVALDTKRTKEASRNALFPWMVTQIHNGTLFRGGNQPQNPAYTPTYQAMKNFAFQAIAGGANGVVFYAYHALWYDTTTDTKNKAKNQAAFNKRWPDVVKVASDIRPLIPILENGKDIPVKVLSEDVDIPVRAIEYQDHMYLLTANPYTKEINLSVELPGDWKLTDEIKKGNPKTITGTTTHKEKSTVWEYVIGSRDSVAISLQKNIG